MAGVTKQSKCCGVINKDKVNWQYYYHHHTHTRAAPHSLPVTVRRVSQGVVGIPVLHSRSRHVRTAPVGRPPRHACRAAALTGSHRAGQPT